MSTRSGKQQKLCQRRKYARRFHFVHSKTPPLIFILRPHSDGVAATSLAAQDATLEHNFGMFSVQTNSEEVAKAIETVAPAVAN